ncbi:hypothetical protein [Pandoraea sp. NPDC087047]|uniref:hypothetical protein n=1 Tax=Pandoraea sp. NPDC087047 TaxID=3364390 RepID=UPI003816BE5D
MTSQWRIGALCLITAWLVGCAPLGNERDVTMGAGGPPAMAAHGTVSAQALQLPGSDVAYLVNQRYRATPQKCFIASPAFECSGVLLRTLPPGSAGAAFWRVSPDETAQGYATLSYARIDLPPVDAANSVGFVLADRPTATGTGQPYALTCGRAPLGQNLPECANDPDAVGVGLWSQVAPAALAVQAIYYDIAHGGQLAEALRDQKQYFDATGTWVPVLKAALGAGTATVFGFDERDQLPWGYVVARDLEARHADTRLTCPGGTPGYYCSGVLIRNTGFGTGFKSWNNTDLSIARNGVSFSYAREDMNMRTTVFTTPGLVMRELQAPAAYPLTWRCSFPTDGGTNVRSDSCNLGADARLCDARGITTAAQWMATYGTGYSFSACALAPTPAQFGVLIDLRKTITAGHNEIIIAAWPPNIPEQLPIEGLFYPTASARPGAQYIQQDYMATTGRFMPVLWIDLTKPAGAIYTYSPNDQDGAMQPGAMFSVTGSGWQVGGSR